MVFWAGVVEGVAEKIGGFPPHNIIGLSPHQFVCIPFWMRGQFAERDGRNRRGAFARLAIHAGEGKSKSKRQPERSECSHMRHKRHPTVELTRRRDVSQ